MPTLLSCCTHRTAPVVHVASMWAAAAAGGSAPPAGLGHGMLPLPARHLTPSRTRGRLRPWLIWLLLTPCAATMLLAAGEGHNGVGEVKRGGACPPTTSAA